MVASPVNRSLRFLRKYLLLPGWNFELAKCYYSVRSTKHLEIEHGLWAINSSHKNGEDRHS